MGKEALECVDSTAQTFSKSLNEKGALRERLLARLGRVGHMSLAQGNVVREGVMDGVTGLFPGNYVESCV